VAPEGRGGAGDARASHAVRDEEVVGEVVAGGGGAVVHRALGGQALVEVRPGEGQRNGRRGVLRAGQGEDGGAEQVGAGVGHHRVVGAEVQVRDVAHHAVGGHRGGRVEGLRRRACERRSIGEQEDGKGRGGQHRGRLAGHGSAPSLRLEVYRRGDGIRVAADGDVLSAARDAVHAEGPRRLAGRRGGDVGPGRRAPAGGAAARAGGAR